MARFVLVLALLLRWDGRISRVPGYKTIFNLWDAANRSILKISAADFITRNATNAQNIPFADLQITGLKLDQLTTQK
jgi:hypothetical protein